MNDLPVKKQKAKLKLDHTTRALMSRLVRGYVAPHRRRLGLALLCMAVAAAVPAGLAYMLEPIMNQALAAIDRTDVAEVAARKAEVLSIAAVIFALFLAKGLAELGEAVLMARVGFGIVAQMQRDLYRRLISLDLVFFNNTSPGTLVARFINDVNLLRGAVSNTLTSIGKDTLNALFLIGVMIWQDWLLAAVACTVLPIAVVPIARVGKRMRKVSGNTQIQVGKLTTLLDESFQGIRSVKAYGNEPQEIARADRTFNEVERLNIKGARTRGLLSPIMEMLGGFAIVAVIVYGTYQVASGNREPGALFSFMTAFMLAYEPFKRLAKLNASLQEGLASAVRLFGVLDQKPAIADKPGATALRLEGGTLSFEAVTFAYHPGAPAALSQFSLQVPAGKTVALVGPSGAGKTTVLSLLPRFYEVDGGSIKIDGQDLRAVTLESLRAAMALVSQEVVLFDDTVAANIAYGRPGASQAEIEAAARHAAAHDFITELGQGYETPVGPRGVKLSGGQRQRIAIARAMLKNAPILLLDEATSALDTDSERFVQAALKELMRGRTTLVIAHRLSTVVDADLICVLREGRIVERGSHSELLALGGDYARLYSQQFASETA